MPTAELLGQSSLATRGSELKVSNTFGAGCIIIYCEWSAVTFETQLQQKRSIGWRVIHFIRGY